MNKTDASKWFDIFHHLHLAGGLDTGKATLYNIAVATSPTNKTSIVLTYKPQPSTPSLYPQDFLTTAPQALQFLRTHIAFKEAAQ